MYVCDARGWIDVGHVARGCLESQSRRFQQTFLVIHKPLDPLSWAYYQRETFIGSPRTPRQLAAAMTTPRFKLSQDEHNVYIDINVPYIRISNCDFYIEENLFSFYCKPYFLKLHLPKPIVDDDRAKAVYNLQEENGTIHVTAPKKVPGEHFEDLQMLTKLLSKPSHALNTAENVNKLKNIKGRNLIEVISSTSVNADGGDESTEPGVDIGDSGGNAKAEKNIATEEAIKSTKSLAANDSNIDSLTKSIANITLTKTISYGFNNRYEKFFVGLRDELFDIIELPNPDEVLASNRRQQRIEKEEADFDMERYAGDYAYGQEDPIYVEAFRIKPFWRKSSTERLKSELKGAKPAMEAGGYSKKNVGGTEEEEEFNENEREILIRLPRREYLIDEGKESHVLICGLATMLYGFAYDFRTASGEANVESSWTISILSPLLSWLDECKDLEQAMVSCMRRSLIYPYLRSYKLSKLIVDDVGCILQSGKHVVLQTLLKVYKIFEKSETKYMINKLFIEDYCVWIQTVRNELLLEYGKKISSLDINKSKLDLELEYIEEQVDEQLQMSSQ